MIKRRILQKFGKEKYNSKPTFKFLIKNIKWVFEFNAIRENVSAELNDYAEKCKVFTHSKDAMKFIEDNY